MKSFSYYLKQSERREWSHYYLNYSELKNLITKFGERRSRLAALSSPDELERFIDTTTSSGSNADANAHATQNGFMYDLFDVACVGDTHVNTYSHAEDDAEFGRDRRHMSDCRQDSIGSLIQTETSDSGNVLIDTNVQKDSGCIGIGSTRIGILRERIYDRASRYEREEFCHVLDAEVAKVTDLYTQQMKRLEQQLADLELDALLYEPTVSSMSSPPPQQHENEDNKPIHTQ